ncbi:MAG: DNA repair protein RecO [Clostridiaceae bacterium]|nr:DNA repair protein RecO [Clostridiaceae bacterium]
MNRVVTKAFVMNSFPWKDRHRLLHLLTPDLGLITAMAPAGESFRSRLRAVTQLFCYAEYTLTCKQSRYSIQDGSVIESFVSISQDLDRLAAASHAAEVFSDVARNDEPQRSLFELWGYTLNEIAEAGDPVFIARMGTLRLMEAIGFSPRLDSCVICNSRLDGPLQFCFREGGPFCGKDLAAAGGETLMPLSAGAASLLRHIASAPLKRLYRFHASPAVRQQAACFADRWVEEKMEKGYRRLTLLDQCPDFVLPVAGMPPEEENHDDLSQPV